ncbi:MAG: hypothetical protein HY897_20665, partial [Deltaproteobacteria bacterium]|nr:hypothetical protein [Deltaproteobacteria bacterium]
MIIRCIGRTALNVSAVCVLMAAAAFGGACTSDLALPAEAQIACGAATDCPTGWTCNANLGRCVRSDVLDSSAPALVGEAAITPPILKRGATATLKFETSEALADFPVVTVKIRGQDRTLTADEKASRGREFIFKYTAVGDEPQDTDCQINIVLTDQSGNRSGNISGRNLRFDFAVPSIDKVSIEGSPAKKGAKVLVRFSVSEPLAAAPAVNLTLALDPSSTGLDYVYSYTATGDESEGAPGAGVTVDIRDEAGNAATGLDAGAAVFDFSTPALKQAPVITPAVVRAGMTATVTFETNEEMKDGFPIVKVGETELAGRAVPGNSYEYGYKVSGLEADGERALRIDLSDLAGNDATNLGGGRFTVDSTPPVISGLVSEKPRYSAVPGHEVATVTFDSTEDVGAGLNVTIGGTAMTCGAWRGASPSYTCTHTVGAAEGEGTKEISVQAVDAAGNTGFESRTVEYDFTGPALSLSVQPNGRPARLGEMVTVGVAAGEALSANGVQIDGGGLELGTPSGSGTSFTWTYTVKATDSGTFNLSATAADAVGNPSAAAATGTVTLDGILPVVSNAALKPARVAKGGTFTLTFDVSEAPAEDPAVAFSNGVDAAVPMAKTSNAGLSYTYTGTAPVSGSAPFYSVTVSLRDAAGNGTVAGAGTVEIDNVAPGFSGIEVAPKAARLSSTIQAVLTATEPLSGPPALTAKNGPDTIAFSPADPTPGKISYSYTYSVTGATAQGTYAIQPFDLTDEATNTRAGVTPNPPVTFSVDSLPASLASASITPNAARHGDVINIEFTASEDLGVPPVVRVGALRIDTCTADPADGRHWTCTHTADTAEGDGVKQVYVELTDLAG